MAIPSTLAIPTADGRKAATPAWFRDRFALGHWPQNMSPTEWQAQLGVVDNGLDLIRAHLPGFDTAKSKTANHTAFQDAGWLTD